MKGNNGSDAKDRSLVVCDVSDYGVISREIKTHTELQQPNGITADGPL